MITCGRSRRMIATSVPTASSIGAMWNESGWLFGSVSTMPGVAVAEHDRPVEADDLAPTRRSSPGRSSAELGLLLLGREAVERLALLAQQRVLQVALLAAGAAHEHGAHALRRVHRARRRALRRLVVGVGVDGEEAASALDHARQSTGTSLPATCSGREPVGSHPVQTRRPAPPSTRRCWPRSVALIRSRLGACNSDGRTLRRPDTGPDAERVHAIDHHRLWSVESLPGVRRPLTPRRTVRTAAIRRSICPWSDGGTDRRPVHVRRATTFSRSSAGSAPPAQRSRSRSSCPTSMPATSCTGPSPASIPRSAGRRERGADWRHRGPERVQHSRHTGHRMARPVPPGGNRAHVSIHGLCLDQQVELPAGSSAADLLAVDRGRRNRLARRSTASIRHLDENLNETRPVIG